MGSESEVLSHRDSTPAQYAAKRGLLARKQEISASAGVIDGAIRTRTSDPLIKESGAIPTELRAPVAVAHANII
jgi:hypothetical protein